MTGSGVGTFVFAPIASALVEWAGWRGCNRVWSSFQYLFLFKFKFLSLVQVKTYLLCLDHQVMAAICSLGFLCGLALAPRARKPSRWWQDLRHFVIAFVLDLVNLQVGVQCDFRLKRVLTCVVSAREKRMETQPVEYLRSGKNFCVPPSFQSVSY